MDSLDMTIEQEVNDTKMKRPHVVVLGAGASRAACLEGDKNGKNLPLMSDFVKVLNLEPLLKDWGISPDQNFEEIFSDLDEKNETDKLRQIEAIVEDYFSELELPIQPTIYDHLILSLREKDLIATFNWDPLLMQAYQRNRSSRLSLPKLAFLHGNVTTGYCEKDKISSLAGMKCRKCGNAFKKTPLLYPIKQKSYASDPFISNEWKQLHWGVQNAFMITIFGYSAPTTDTEAIAAMKNAWGDVSDRSLEQTTFITTRTEDEIVQTWDSFIHTHHYHVYHDFYDSWIANHPRRTGEAYWNQNLEAKFIENNPIPREQDFSELWEWFEQFKTPETRE